MGRAGAGADHAGVKDVWSGKKSAGRHGISRLIMLHLVLSCAWFMYSSLCVTLCRLPRRSVAPRSRRVTALRSADTAVSAAAELPRGDFAFLFHIVGACFLLEFLRVCQVSRVSSVLEEHDDRRSEMCLGAKARNQTQCTH